MRVIILLMILLFTAVTAIRYQIDIRRAYDRLESFKVDIIETEFGK